MIYAPTRTNCAQTSIKESVTTSLFKIYFQRKSCETWDVVLSFRQTSMKPMKHAAELLGRDGDSRKIWKTGFVHNIHVQFKFARDEIAENLPQGVPLSDRPELLARVFHLTLQELMQVIDKQ